MGKKKEQREATRQEFAEAIANLSTWKTWVDKELAELKKLSAVVKELSLEEFEHTKRHEDLRLLVIEYGRRLDAAEARKKR